MILDRYLYSRDDTNTSALTKTHYLCCCCYQIRMFIVSVDRVSKDFEDDFEDLFS